MRGTGEPTESRGRVTYRTMDLLVAAILMVVGAVVMKVATIWAPAGPRPGRTPATSPSTSAPDPASSTVTLLITLFGKPDRTPFVEAKQFFRVLQVLIPSFIFVLAIRYIGIYVAGGLFIAFFMWWLGKYSACPRSPWWACSSRSRCSSCSRCGSSCPCPRARSRRPSATDRVREGARQRHAPRIRRARPPRRLAARRRTAP